MSAPLSLRLLDVERSVSADPGPLTAFDFVLVNSSAGKDSQAMLDMLHERASREGVLSRLVVVHADLGRVEWTGTRELAQAQAECYGLRFEVVERPQGDLLAHIEKHGKFPDKARRYCTSDHKTHQVYRLLTQLAGEWRESQPEEAKKRPCRILNCLGMRAEESPDRAKLDALGPDKPASNSRREVTRWLPIHDWSESEVWARIRASKSAELAHYCYSLGMSRASCCFCILSSKGDLEIAARHNPDLLREYVAVEAHINHRFRLDLSMAELAQRTGVLQ